MRIDILGTLRVSNSDHEPITIRETKVREMLLWLLVSEGAVVSVDRLTELLWPHKLPKNPSASVHNKIWQLRRTLDEADPGSKDLVQAMSGGYRLDHDSVDIDAATFERMVHDSRQLGPENRAMALGDALALWRGPAFVDIADNVEAQSVASRLEELRLTALEDHAEARLALGEHHHVAADLDVHLRQHPHRERLRAAQMRALYRSGRQVQALDSFDELRVHLADELGIDPGPELVALRQAILEQNADITSAVMPRAKIATNLPAETSSLIGRTSTIARVRAHLDSSRLVTLTGVCGVGKTRVAIATAAGIADDYPDGVWLIELSQIDPKRDDPYEALVSLVSNVLDIQEEQSMRTQSPSPSRPPVTRLLDSVRRQRVLLLLDNCEHQIDQTTRLARLLLQAAPNLKILATSQEPLNVPGEIRYKVPPLELPAGEPDHLGETNEMPSAVELFVERTTAIAEDFALDLASAPAVHRICKRLDGIPLALELAATRVPTLGVDEVADRLEDRFALLSKGPRGAPARQQTLRAAIDWSWSLLTESERRILSRLAVHTGSFTLSSAEAVCADLQTESRADNFIDHISRLVERSLVAAKREPAGLRYSLFESIAEFCLEHLAQANELNETRTRHLHHQVELVSCLSTQLRGRDQAKALEQLNAESINVRSALEFAVRSGHSEEALTLANSMAWHWFLRGQLSEAVKALRLVLSSNDADRYPAARTSVMAWLAALSLRIGDDRRFLTECESIEQRSSEVHDRPTHAFTLWLLGFAQIGLGDQVASRRRIQRSHDEFREIGGQWGTAAALAALAAHAMLQSDFDEIEDYGRESYETFLKIGDSWGRLQALDSLAFISEVRGNYNGAVKLHAEGLAVAEDLGMWSEVALKRSGLGRIALLQGDLRRARELHESALTLAAKQGFTFGEQYAEVGLGMVSRREGGLDAAEAHFTRWLDWCREWQGHSGTTLLLAELGFIAELRGQIDVAETMHKEGYASAIESGDSRAVGLALEGLAGARAGAQYFEEAAELLGAAESLRAKAGAPLATGERGDVNRVNAIVRHKIGGNSAEISFLVTGSTRANQLRSG